MKKILIILNLFLIISASLVISAIPYSNNETLISSGGSNISSSSYETDAVISQISGNVSAGSYITGLGFFYAILNNIPVFSTIPSQTWNQDTSKIINLSQYSSDLDNDELSYTSTSPTNIGVSISNGIATLTPSSGFYGTRSIVFYADDGADIINSNTVGLTISQVSAPPGGGPGGPDEVKAFTMDKNLIKLLLKQGGNKSEWVKVKNTGDVKLEFIIDTSEINEFVIVDEYAFELGSGQEKTLKFDFYASEIQAPDVYTGRIKIKGNGIEKIINTIIEVQQKEALFDINLIIFPETKKVRPEEIVRANLTLINLGDLQDVDVELELVIKDMQGKIIDSKHETLAVLGEGINITKEFKVPKKTKPGDYVLYAKLTYKESIATASDIFSVIEAKKIKIGDIAKKTPDKIKDFMGGLKDTFKDLYKKHPGLATGITIITLWILLAIIILIYLIIRKYVKLRDQLLGYRSREDQIAAIERFKRSSREDNFFERIVDKTAMSIANKKMKIGKSSEIHELYNIAKNFYHKKDYKKALKEFQKSVDLDNKFWQGYEGLGNCYFALGKERKAIAAYEKSLSLNPNNTKLAQWLKKYKEK